MSSKKQFDTSIENDSFDDILATMDVPAKAAPSQSNTSSGSKKSRLSFDSDNGLSDSILANISMPTTSTSSVPQVEKAVNAPISAGKTNCVLVNPKQRGIFI